MIKQLLFITLATLSINAHGAAEYPLHDAVKNKDINRVQQLLAINETNVNQKNGFGITPLHEAARDNRFEIAELLIKHGAEINAKEQDKWTPLHLAAWYGYLDIAKLLINYGADTNAKNKNGKTPLEIARIDIYYELKVFIDSLTETKEPDVE